MALGARDHRRGCDGSLGISQETIMATIGTFTKSMDSMSIGRMKAAT